MRFVNVHEAKTQLSGPLDAAHAGETILLAKAGRPWARLMPLEGQAGWRRSGGAAAADAPAAPGAVA